MQALETTIGQNAPQKREIRFDALRTGMIMAAPIISEKGMVLLREGVTVSEVTLMRLHNFSHRAAIKGPIKIVSTDQPLTATHQIDDVSI